MTRTTSQNPPTVLGPDDVSVRHWMGFYAVFLAAMLTGLFWALPKGGDVRLPWEEGFSASLAATPTAVKLLVFVIYTSLCCTFLPLPTSGVVAAVATADAHIASGMWTTALIVATLGAAASTIANLNDYHLLTWMLRHDWIAGIRRRRSYELAARWFSRSPFLLLVMFNLLPIPVDVVRMLATSSRYPRIPFALANFVGRFARYGVIALATFSLGESGWVAVVALLALAGAIGLSKGLPAGRDWLRRRAAARGKRPDPGRSRANPAAGADV